MGWALISQRLTWHGVQALLWDGLAHRFGRARVLGQWMHEKERFKSALFVGGSGGAGHRVRQCQLPVR